MVHGGKVLLLEDVTTTGGSAVQAIERIHNETDCKVIAVISIVDREEGAQEMFEDLGIPFESLVLRSHITEM
jgi:orotate phosphoribosyltransferase